jgi:hypothetical protein
LLYESGCEIGKIEDEFVPLGWKFQPLISSAPQLSKNFFDAAGSRHRGATTMLQTNIHPSFQSTREGARLRHHPNVCFHHTKHRVLCGVIFLSERSDKKTYKIDVAHVLSLRQPRNCVKVLIVFYGFKRNVGSEEREFSKNIKHDEKGAS